jgi:hypothetical protein
MGAGRIVIYFFQNRSPYFFPMYPNNMVEKNVNELYTTATTAMGLLFNRFAAT